MNSKGIDHSSETQSDAEASAKPRTDAQRRRLLVAAIAGAPLIVASSAQTAHADTENSSAYASA